MQVRIRVFGGLTEFVGGSRVDVELPESATVGDLRERLVSEYPSLGPWLPRTQVALDLEVADERRTIRPDAQVALLPPVAGGADDATPGPAGAARVLTGLRRPPFDVDAVVAEVAGPTTGGTAVFLGTVRDHAPDLGPVVRLDYSAYDEMAEKVLATIAEEVLTAHRELTGVALLHALGELEVGEHTVLIVCSSPHRDVAFDACREALEQVKDRVPVFKREVTPGGSHRWVGLEDGDAPATTTPGPAMDGRA